MLPSREPRANAWLAKSRSAWRTGSCRQRLARLIATEPPPRSSASRQVAPRWTRWVVPATLGASDCYQATAEIVRFSPGGAAMNVLGLAGNAWRRDWRIWYAAHDRRASATKCNVGPLTDVGDPTVWFT